MDFVSSTRVVENWARWKDGQMTCDLMSFSTVFQLYQDDGWMVMKGCVQWNLVNG